ncbi:MAG TPA: ankyrin repeat domain-containing protein [Thermomicrobiaceae bacterium]|nr:ankyrin repeat domain-containing protein [Thermomicrobiaceae bacterium]
MSQASESERSSGVVTQDTVDEFVGNAHGNLPRVQELLRSHPSLLRARARWDEDALGAAAHAGSRPVAEFLLAEGAPLDLPTAAMLGRVDDVEAYLSQDPAAANGSGAHGLSILYHAAAGGSIPVAALLLANDVNVNTGSGANTALHAAASKGNAEMARWLLDRGADPGALDYEGKTPLQIAEESGHEELTELLRRSRAG